MLLAFAVLAIAPSAGGAATICVHVSSASCDSSLENINEALEMAAKTPADDRVVIGPGRFEGPFHYGAPGDSGHIEVIGQGPSTVLTAPSGSTRETVLSVPGDAQGQGSVVSYLTVHIPSNTSGSGDVGIFAGALGNVRVASDAGEPTPLEEVGVELSEPGGYLRSSVVELVDGSTDDVGVRSAGSSGRPTTTISDSRIIAPNGIVAAAQSTAVVRDRVSARTGVLACNAPVTVEDSLLRVNQSGAALAAEGSNQCSPAEQASILVRQVTIVGEGTASGAVGATAISGNSGQNPRVDMTLSIVRSVQTAFRAASGVAGSSATITVGASDFEAGRVVESALGGNVSFSEPEPDIDADPLFTSDLLGEFTLRAGSPAIDSTYSPPLAAGESMTDLNGDPRVLDGNGDGVAARDMGAYEAPAVPVPPDTTPPDTRIVKPKKAKKKLQAGSHGYRLKVSFTSTEAGSHFECRLDAGKFAACASPFKKVLAAGLHRFEVRAVDAAGNVDPTPARENFRIARAPAAKHRHHHRPL